MGAICWAACAKNPSLSPRGILEFAKRHVAYQPEELQKLELVKPTTLIELKLRWIAAVDQAEALFPRLPHREAGCLYLNKEGEPVTPVPEDPSFGGLTRHFGSVRGAWPKVS